jgi:hypothetical protein
MEGDSQRRVCACVCEVEKGAQLCTFFQNDTVQRLDFFIFFEKKRRSASCVCMCARVCVLLFSTFLLFRLF